MLLKEDAWGSAILRQMGTAVPLFEKSVCPWAREAGRLFMVEFSFNAGG
jgi:hypothetical protein